jgi:hypothetical protein
MGESEPGDRVRIVATYDAPSPMTVLLVCLALAWLLSQINPNEDDA